MLLKTSLASVGLAITVLATPANAVVNWQGDAVIDTVTPQCATADATRAVRVGDIFRVVLQPKSLPGNGPDTLFHFLDQTRLFHMTLPLGAKPTGTATTLGFDENGINKTGTSAYTLWVHTPSSILTTTLTATVKGQVPNFMFVTGCTVRFRSSVVKRPD